MAFCDVQYLHRVAQADHIEQIMVGGGHQPQLLNSNELFGIFKYCQINLFMGWMEENKLKLNTKLAEVLLGNRERSMRIYVQPIYWGF